MNPVDERDQERRITFQLYEYWVGLANDHGIPSLKSLTPDDIAHFKNNMVLIDLRDLNNEPTLQVIGHHLKEDLEQDLTLQPISEIPRRTLLSRITDHYLEVLANRRPISFDAEFKNKSKEKILYRGILLPFSDDGDKINFILGAIRWISEAEKQKFKITDMSEFPDVVTEQFAPESDAPSDDIEEINPVPLKSDPIADAVSVPLLQEKLDHCRRLVQGQNPADLRSRKSLYDALGAILDFYQICASNPKNYQKLLKSEGLNSQKRAPYTPVLKLCFGQDYDKTRLTEYAAALSYACKNNRDGNSLADFLENFPGGIKGCVKAERDARHDLSGKKPKNTLEDRYKIINKMPVIAHFPIDEEDETDKDLCLVLARRNGAQMDILKILKEEDKTLDAILKRITQSP